MRKQKHDIANYSEYKKNLTKTLLEVQIDADWSGQQLDFQDIQFNRRSFVKNIIGFVEFYIWFLKSIYFKSSDGISEIEVAYLESNASLVKQLNKNNSKEAIIIKDIKDDLLKVLSLFEETFFSSLDLNNCETIIMLEKLTNLKVVRNRISHPKTYKDIIISNEEIKKAKELYTWLTEKTYLWFVDIIDNIEIQK
jgi:hypothetical protein